MSVWTHVAGIIRVDDIDWDDGCYTAPNWDEIVGKELFYQSDSTLWDEYDNNPDAFMPTGSEGSLHKSIWVNPKKSSVTKYSVSIFGDLRDYGDIDAVANWFGSVCEKLWVRNAFITVECELGAKLTAYWNDDKLTIQRNEV